MLLQLIFRKHRRAVSPVIAMILIIALALAAAATVVAILNGVLGGNLGFGTDDLSLGSAEGTSEVTKPTINVTAIQGDTNLKSRGIDDYIEVTVEVVNRDDNSIYVIDIDLTVFGQKLDEIAQWQIVRVDGARTSDVGSESYNGLRQFPGSEASYTVRLPEKFHNLTQARIPESTPFTYEVYYGSVPGVITDSVSKTKFGSEFFSPIFYDVAILHSGSSFIVNSAARQFENTLKAWNGSNSIYFDYSRTTDAYDYMNSPGSIVGETLMAMYDIIIIDVWAVPQVISSELLTMHNNATKLIFYGSVSSLGSTTTEIMNNIDVAATDEILGVTPNMFQGDPTAVDVTDHSYQFYAGSSVLAGLFNQGFEEIEDDSYTSGSSDSQSPGVCGEGATATGTGVGDTFGYDIATFTGNATNYIEYGVSSYSFKQDTGTLQEMGNSPFTSALFVEKFGDTSFAANETLAYSFIWKHNNDLGPPGSDLFDGGQLSQVRINMLAGVVGQSNRVVTFTPSSSIDGLSIDTPPSGGSSNKLFDMSVFGTVENSDILNGSLTITVNMPEYEFHDCNPSLGKNTEFGSFFVDGVEVVSNEIIVTISADSIVTIDISNYFDQTISVGSSYELALGVVGTEMFKINSDETIYNWTVTVDSGAAGSINTRVFERSVDSGSDLIEPNKVTGLSVDGVTSTTIDISWNVAADNGGGTVALYSIYANDTFLANTTSTSYTHSGLSQGDRVTYKVRAVDDSGNVGLFSNPVTGSTFGPPPDVSVLNATTISSTRIDLNWSQVNNVAGYRIYRNNTLISTLTNGSTVYADTSLSPDTTYSYEVYSWNNTIQSANPAIASNTTNPLSGNEPGMYVQSIVVDFLSGNPKGDLNVIITIYDSANNQPLSGVFVSIEFEDETGTTAIYSGSGTTGADGTVTIFIDASATLVSQGQNNDNWTTRVTDITRSGYVHDTGSSVTTLSGVAETDAST